MSRTATTTARPVCASRAGGSNSGCRIRAAIPIFALAALVAAGLDGLDRKLDPGEPTNVNMYELTEAQLAARKIALLPQNLLEAVQALEQDEVVKAGLGPELAKEFLLLKRMEWTEYARHVSDWETKRYLEFF